MIRELTRWKRLWLPLAALCLMAALFAACGGDDEDSKATTTPATATAAATTAATTAPTTTGAALNITTKSNDAGSYLTGPDGKTLYVFIKDAPGKSNCAAACLTTWPPLMQKDGEQVKADAVAKGTFATIDTTGGKQVTYNGAPLYTFAADTAPGDTKGNLVGGIWFVARPDTASTFVVGVQKTGAKAPYLVGPTGMTLYTFANDTANTSACTGTCITNWPALTVPDAFDPTKVTDATGALGIFVRDDGKRQVTYKGAPLYYFAADKKTGDTTGDGVGTIWHIATP
jgi:predicted lipoprotein with Yx(FWY)xxD motif